jgi:hypothetical protein
VCISILESQTPREKACYSLWNYFILGYGQVVETILKSAEGREAQSVDFTFIFHSAKQ